jgi:hypothetical protein
MPGDEPVADPELVLTAPFETKLPIRGITP